MPDSRLLFDRFELLPTQRRLLRDGEVVALRTKAFDLLVVLAERAGRLVTKNELLELVWPGLVVEENNIAAQIVSLRKVLGGQVIETVPGRGYRFIAEIRDAKALTTAAPSLPMPGPQRLFGRDDDLSRLEAALAAARSVTLVGPGGVGKTALARAVASRSGAAQQAWVDLAALGDADQLHGALCRALRIESAGGIADDEARIAATLATGPWLVLLDNAEHLIDAVAALSQRLLAAGPSLSLLVTGQLPLRIAGEHVHALEPLAVANGEAEPEQADGALSTPALQMMVERIRATDARFPIGADARPLLSRLCARLDGLPLALEMAAAVVPLLGVQGVLDALDQRFAVLRRGQRRAPARHRTLRAAIEWSHDLLPPTERRVLRRLGVFSSGFSLDLATAVAADDDGQGEDRWATLDALAELVNRSLVASQHADPPRYRLLETVRAYALEQLEATGETGPVHARGVRALTAALSAAAERGAADPDAGAELDNVPGLLAWARVHDRPAALALTIAAAKVATWTPWLSEAVRWVDAGEALLGDDVPLALQAEWWRELARFQTFVRGPRAVEAARRAVDRAAPWGTQRGCSGASSRCCVRACCRPESSTPCGGKRRRWSTRIRSGRRAIASCSAAASRWSTAAAATSSPRGCTSRTKPISRAAPACMRSPTTPRATSPRR